MEHEALLQRKHAILNHLSSLPRKMLFLHGRDNVIEFVLHDLSENDCFNLEKAVYVIDNPDFDCLKGIAGFSRSNAYTAKEDIWNNSEDFSRHMQCCSFNKKVRSFSGPSFKRRQKPDQEIVEEIAYELDLNHPKFYAWDMKHGNHGLLLYEKHEQDECDCTYLLDGLCLLGFCPVF